MEDHDSEISGMTMADVEFMPISPTYSVTNRLRTELLALMMANVPGISALPDEHNILKWLVTIESPANTVYATQKYRISLEFTETYPFGPPIVKFLTPCFHPNVDAKGEVSLDILADEWCALYGVRALLLSLELLLGEPNNKTLNIDAAQMWKDQKKYKDHLDEFYEQHKDAAN